MDYKKIYIALIESRKERVFNEGCIYEKHHILPKSMGGSDDSDNLIDLTPREHFLAHWLLWRIYRNREMAYAFRMMSTYRKYRRGHIAYKESKMAMKECGHSEETLRKWSDACRDRFKGKPKSEKWIEKKRIQSAEKWHENKTKEMYDARMKNFHPRYQPGARSGKNSSQSSPVILTDSAGNQIFFHTQREAMEFFGIKSGNAFKYLAKNGKIQGYDVTMSQRISKLDRVTLC